MADTTDTSVDVGVQNKERAHEAEAQQDAAIAAAAKILQKGEEKPAPKPERKGGDEEEPKARKTEAESLSEAAERLKADHQGKPKSEEKKPADAPEGDQKGKTEKLRYSREVLERARALKERRRLEREVKERDRALETHQQAAKNYVEIQRLAKEDPAALLRELGIEAPTKTQAQTQNLTPEQQRQAEVEKKVKEIEAWTKERQQAERRSAVERTQADLMRRAGEAIADKDRFEFLHANGGAERVVRAAVDAYQSARERGADAQELNRLEREELSFDRVADRLEAHFEREFKRQAALKKAGGKPVEEKKTQTETQNGEDGKTVEVAAHRRKVQAPKTKDPLEAAKQLEDARKARSSYREARQRVSPQPQEQVRVTDRAERKRKEQDLLDKALALIRQNPRR